jgi:hypothetical protein
VAIMAKRIDINMSTAAETWYDGLSEEAKRDIDTMVEVIFQAACRRAIDRIASNATID